MSATAAVGIFLACITAARAGMAAETPAPLNPIASISQGPVRLFDDSDHSFNEAPQPRAFGGRAAERAVEDRPVQLFDDVENIYAPIEPAKPNTGVNQGGVHVTLNINYLTDYIYRGIDRSEIGAINPAETGKAAEDAPNLQFDAKLSFDVGRAPHPFIGVFVNVFNDDPISRFQEVRPYFGFDWRLKPLYITAGWQAYIFPERDDFNTSEIFAKIELDDSVIFRTDRPVFTPYLYAAYDHDRYDGFYLEAGIKHDFIIEDTGITLTAVADVGYVYGNGFFTAKNGDDIGFQHYDVGLIGSYSLNTLLNVSRRYGEWKLKGYLFYTDGIENNLRSDTELWGGVGIQFDY